MKKYFSYAFAGAIALTGAVGFASCSGSSGEDVVNTNRSFNMQRMKLYVCPICGNLIQSTGEAVVSCCGIVLPALEAEPEDENHRLHFEKVEDEYYVTIPHDMSKTHYISYIMALKDDGWEIIKLYPEGNAEARFKICKTKCFCYFCNKHGLFRTSVR